MDSGDSDMDCSEGSGSSAAEDVPHSQLPHPRARFSEAQRACLNAYFCNGMAGVGKRYSSLIARASSDTQLTVDQVKVIPNLNHRSKYTLIYS